MTGFAKPVFQGNGGSATQDVVGVFDGFSQVFRAARPMKASIKEEATLMEHPTESGVVITDHMVLKPVEIELAMTLTPDSYRDTYQEIKNLYRNGKILTVQSKTDTYKNQLICALPHEESPEHFDTIILTLRLKEVKIVTAEFRTEYKPQKAEQAKNTDRGEVQPHLQEKPQKFPGVPTSPYR